MSHAHLNKLDENLSKISRLVESEPSPHSFRGFVGKVIDAFKRKNANKPIPATEKDLVAALKKVVDADHAQRSPGKRDIEIELEDTNSSGEENSRTGLPSSADFTQFKLRFISRTEGSTGSAPDMREPRAEAVTVYIETDGAGKILGTEVETPDNSL